MDTSLWLLEQGVDPTSIQWIKPREAWWINRKFNQPHTLLPDFLHGTAIQFQAMAEATSISDLFHRLENKNFFLRVDPNVETTKFAGAVVSEGELELVRQIKDVVRMGHVRSIDKEYIYLDDGRIQATPDTVYVHCASNGLARPPLRAIFEADRVTVQPFMWGFACFQFAMLGVVEALVPNEEEKNQICTPIQYWNENADYLSAFLANLANARSRNTNAAVSNWARTSRLNPLGDAGKYRDHPVATKAQEQIKAFGASAAKNLQALLQSKAS